MMPVLHHIRSYRLRDSFGILSLAISDKGLYYVEVYDDEYVRHGPFESLDAAHRFIVDSNLTTFAQFDVFVED